jgi:predicted amidohydrolase
VLDRDGRRHEYRKMHLGSSEAPFFTPGDSPLALDVPGARVGLAICADTSRASHPQACAALGADVYAAGVMLTEEWYDADAPRLAAYARDLGLLTLMANHGASRGTYASVGRSAAWAPGGAVLAEAAGDEDCLVLVTRDVAGWQGHVERL